MYSFLSHVRQCSGLLLYLGETPSGLRGTYGNPRIEPGSPGYKASSSPIELSF